ncbi:integrin [Streptomyces viridochromogenes]|uniref:Integrin n=1 Tax=Streptomyces viridochromogenes TaxID=1938 RepID=A0A0J7Z644_STRVR|nr:FG-GAP and VCBS repeat-containing protein [Streptomyces viridochromogenes]KMS71274.1 integrin [Streptomyces viridochromogenes]KOG15942.1 integrin [Streptomyces viridochromogenes]KOG16708.1 integrin [Streptomyces viridochromogenes]
MHKHHLRRPARLALATATATALTGGLLTLATATSATAADSVQVPYADFNGDGTGDVVASAHGAYVSGRQSAGQIVVLYGTATGVSSAKRTTISQNTTGNPGTAEAGDGFGAESAYADFNGDGYDDLAVSSPWEKVGTDTNGGGVAVLWGSASGLTGKGVTIADPAPSSHDYWGKDLAAGDFDGDGKADLAVGNSSNTIHVFKGGFDSTGTPGGRYTIKPPIQNGSNDYPYGPMSLTAGDVNGDKRTDLIVDGYETRTDYGWNTNYYVPGTAGGLSAGDAEALKPGIITAIGDINGDGYGDIVSGAGWDSTTEDGTPVPDAANGGKVNITYGSTSGPATTAGITQNSGNVPGTAEKGDGFGWELDLGDINGDGYQDLVVASPNEDIDGAANTGQVTVLYGSANGIDTVSGVQGLAQSTAGVPGNDEKNDLFGADVKLDDVTGDGKADLVIGSYENAGNGGLTYLPSNGTKITTSGSRAVAPSTSGLSTTGSPAFGAVFAD